MKLGISSLVLLGQSGMAMSQAVGWTVQHGSAQGTQGIFAIGVATSSDGSIYLSGNVDESLDGQPYSGGMYLSI